MANALRVQLMVILNERVASRAELARDLALPYDKVRYEMGALERDGLVRVKTEKKVRGATTAYYEATQEPFIDKDEWLSVPAVLKNKLRGSLFQTLIEDATDALMQDTYDDLPDAHMSWFPMLLDERGWKELMVILEEALDAAREVKKRCAKDLVDADTSGIPCTVSIMGYMSTGVERHVEPPGESVHHGDA